MFKKAKRLIAGIIASAMVLTSAGCGVGKNTAYALTVDGYQVKAGVYIYYAYSAINEAKDLAEEVHEGDESFDKEDRKDLENTQIEGKDFMTWVKDKTTETCANHVAIIKHFDELGLSLTEDEQSELDNYIESEWASQSKMYESNGIGRESIEEILTMSYKTEAVFNAYYGADGSEGVTEQQLKDFYVDNHMRAKYIAMDLHDAEGNELDDAGRREIDNLANDFLRRAENASRISAQNMLNEFTAMQTEYDQFVVDQAEAADGEEAATEAATEAPTEAPTDGEAVVTTTVDPYANETIINVVTTAAADESETDSDESVHYTPSEKVYNWLLKDAKNGVPEIIEDEENETLYVAVKLDINERINEDDLWNESSVSNVRDAMFSEDFKDLIKSWIDSYTIERNEKAYKRYDPFDITTEV